MVNSYTHESSSVGAPYNEGIIGTEAKYLIFWSFELNGEGHNVLCGNFILIEQAIAYSCLRLE
jgi:hypothetical protein